VKSTTDLGLFLFVAIALFVTANIQASDTLQPFPGYTKEVLILGLCIGGAVSLVCAAWTSRVGRAPEQPGKGENK
jgi:hypothetical protein